MRILWMAVSIAAALCGQTAVLNPTPVDEERIAMRLVEMVKPTAGERAVIVYDPTYYPGITKRVREELFRRGVQSQTLVDDTDGMMASYAEKPVEQKKREDEIVDQLRPLFLKSQIFYWMPVRDYAGDLRWERLVNESSVRSVHFHWILGFPAGRDEAAAREECMRLERISLDSDFGAVARRQQRLAAALRGKQIRVTSANGSDLQFRIPADQWFHQGDGDMSKARADQARSIRDRQNEFPPGMFGFVPDAHLFSGVLLSESLSSDFGEIRGVKFRFKSGRAVEMQVTSGQDALRQRMRQIGPDADRIATIFFHRTNELSTSRGVQFDVGSNWENGGSNRADGMRRMIFRLADATVTADGVVIMRNGELEWGSIP